ncbi:choice-of-anchor D domain-containing protein [Prosthecobacter sp. SYSU 5D2]|uniref:choice-of-anchor D domain-containing protein n=1 Tax=Prosthecobacter sp. SYSU 5D2 TaxID=3134134 RepID=UPI0031FED666
MSSRRRTCPALTCLRLLALIGIAWLGMISSLSHAAPPFPEFVDPRPREGNQFGKTVVVLSTGNVVITAPFDDAGGYGAGAVYLFNGATGALISTLRGASGYDFIGNGGITALSNGNFVVSSSSWSNGTNYDVGAVTWGSGISGVSGTVSSSNSLVGSKAHDSVGQVTALSNGNYLVCSQSWDNGNVVDAGALTWCDGSSPTIGRVSSSNSLVGSKAEDRLGNWGVMLLSNGNYLVRSPDWDGSTVDAGAVTWVSGSSAMIGVISSSNSLVGSRTGDKVGSGGVKLLSNGNYVVCSPDWNNGSVVDAGAVTWGSGSSGVSGVVSSSNSLVGSTASDQVGSGGVTVLSNGNYVVGSSSWDNGTVWNAGAVTWCDGNNGTSGEVSSSNSLVGSTDSDELSSGGVTALTNGNYVVCSPLWGNGRTFSYGAVTWCNGSSGATGEVNSSNSLVGNEALDAVGYGGVTALSNGNYVVSSPHWGRLPFIYLGAVTWGDGSSGVSGSVNGINSLIGSTMWDGVGSGGVKALSNGNYVVCSPLWGDGLGAVTWGSGSSGVNREIKSSNSLLGSTVEDYVGNGGVTELSNGNYVVLSSDWSNGTADKAGAVTWGSGSSGISGVVSSSNSLVGSKADDQVGDGGVTRLSNGNYVVVSSDWSNGTADKAGAVTWGSGSGGVSGTVGSSNSLVGSKFGDQVGSGGVTSLINGNYVVCSPNWDNGTFVNAGAVTWGDGSSGVSGAVSAAGSLVGLTRDANLGYVIVDYFNGTYFGRFIDENSGKVRLGSQGDGLAVYAPTVTGINPSSGSTAGGTVVTITGTDLTGATAVTFGGTNATAFTVNRATQITATVPPHEEGMVSVLVTTPGGTSEANSLFTYIRPAPTVSLNTSNLTGNATSLTITGANFDAVTPGNNTVVFTPAGSGTVTASTATSLTVTNLSGQKVGALYATVTTNNQSSGTAVQVATVINSAPTDLALSSNTLAENSPSNTTVGILSSTDPNADDTFTYTLVTGAGSTNNASFNISGNALRFTASPNYETKSSYTVRVRTRDAGNLTFEKSFAITITNVNEPPTGLTLSGNMLPEASPPNSTVGTLSSNDPDAAETFTYTLVAGAGSTDNGAFNILGNALRLTASPNYDVKSSYSVRVRTTDAGGLIFARSFTIGINETNEAPTALALSGNTLPENNLANATVGSLSATDPNVDQTHTFSIVEGTGDTDNDDFSIVGTDLRISVSTDYETKSSYSLRVQADDGEGGTFEEVFILMILDVAEPVIAVLGRDQVIINGDTTPDAADATDFGNAALVNAPVTHLFTIANDGDAVLNLASPAVVLSGPGAADFKVTTLPAAAVAASDQTTFAITFDPRLPGLRTATVTVASDDGANGSYSFAISGFGGLSKLKTQTITFAPPKTVYLGQSSLTLSAYASSELPVTLNVVPVGTTAAGAGIVGNVLSFAGIGKVKVQAVQAGDGNYAAAKTVVKTITVKATPAALTLVDLAQSYTGTPRVIGTLGGSGEVTIEYKIGTAFGSTAPTAAGKYSVKATDSTGTKTGTLTISKAPLYVTPDDKRKFAGQENPALTSVYSGFMASDTAVVFTKTPVLKTKAKATSGGGLYPITASAGAAANYLFVYQQGTMVVESFGGSYEALLVDASALPVGKLMLTVPLTGQAFTGKLATAKETAALSLKGSLTISVENEIATGTATVMKGAVPYVVSFTLPMKGDVLVTAMRDGQPLSSAVTGRKLLVLPKGGKVLYSGAHTAVLEPALPAVADIPAGAGWAKSTLSTTGVMTLAGRLADGTVFTTALAPDADPDPGYRLFVQPYKKRTESYLGGVFTLLPHPTQTNRRYVIEAGLTWQKAGLAADATYRAGFGPVTTVMMLDPWLPPVTAKGSTPAITLATRLGLTDNSFEVMHSDTASTLHGNLPTRVGLSLKNVVSVQLPLTTPVNSTKWKTKLVPKTGLFSGSFELADTTVKPRVVTFSGVLRQPATEPDVLIGNGHYLLPALPGAPSNERLSGEVRFVRP